MFLSEDRRHCGLGWRPDWKDPDLYPDPKTTSGDQWAWEFLRRSEKYISDCADVWIDPNLLKAHESVLEAKRAGEGVSDMLLGLAAQVNPERLESYKAACLHHGLWNLIHPSENFSRRIALNMHRSTKMPWQWIHEWHQVERIQLPDGRIVYLSDSPPTEGSAETELLFSIDLSVPLDWTISTLHKILQDRQQRLVSEEKLAKPTRAASIPDKKTSPEKLRLFLRLLDARAAECKFTDIAKTITGDIGINLCQEADSHCKNHTRARKFCSRDYRYLLSYGTEPPIGTQKSKQKRTASPSKANRKESPS